jgi:hypothetical protein
MLAKKNAYLASPYSPVCQHVCAGLPLGVFSWSLILVIFYENLSVKFSFGYSRTNIWRGGGGFTWRREYEYSDTE